MSSFVTRLRGRLIKDTARTQTCTGFWKGPANLQEEIDLLTQDVRDVVGEAYDKYGRVLAAEYFHGAWPAGHTWPGYDVGQKTSIEGLYNVGDGVKVPGWSSGTPAAAKTARVVVEDILNRYKPGAN